MITLELTDTGLLESPFSCLTNGLDENGNYMLCAYGNNKHGVFHQTENGDTTHCLVIFEKDDQKSFDTFCTLARSEGTKEQVSFQEAVAILKTKPAYINALGLFKGNKVVDYYFVR